MLKSTSRQILEVTHTNNPYFERAFFVVRHNCADQPDLNLDGEAQQVLCNQPLYSGLHRSRLRNRLIQSLSFLLGGAVGAAVTICFFCFM